MNLTRYEKETIISYNEEEKTANVYTYNNTLKNRLAEFATKSDKCVLIKDDGDCAIYKVPKKWVKIRMPRQYSPEELLELQDRARKNLVRKKETE